MVLEEEFVSIFYNIAAYVGPYWASTTTLSAKIRHFPFADIILEQWPNKKCWDNCLIEVLKIFQSVSNMWTVDQIDGKK